MNKKSKARSAAVYAFLVCAFLLLTAFEPADVERERCLLQEEYHADCSRFKADGAGEAENVILIIGDGMGIGQTYAGRVYLNGPEELLAWEKLPYTGLVNNCAIHHITDSAASGTAIATGHKTSVGTVSMGTGLDPAPYKTILELVKDRKATGLVTNTELWDATPAVFASHAPRRSMSRSIARQMVEEARVDVLMGGGAEAFYAEGEAPDMVARAAKLGYTVVKTDEQLAAVDAGDTKRLLGLFAPDSMRYEVERKPETTEPRLSQMAEKALQILERYPRGFFLMVEGARIDHACHEVSMEKLVGQMVEFDKTVNLLLEWAGEHPHTLVLITADHETGGIDVKEGDYRKGDRVEVKWKSALLPGIYANHSNQRVPVYGVGPNAAAIQDRMDNTEVFCIMKNAFPE